MVVAVRRARRFSDRTTNKTSSKTPVAHSSEVAGRSNPGPRPSLVVPHNSNNNQSLVVSLALRRLARVLVLVPSAVLVALKTRAPVAACSVAALRRTSNRSQVYLVVLPVREALSLEARMRLLRARALLCSAILSPSSLRQEDWEPAVCLAAPSNRSSNLNRNSRLQAVCKPLSLTETRTGTSPFSLVCPRLAHQAPGPWPHLCLPL